MGMVVVISLPLVIFSLVLGLGCYFLGRSRGRKDVRTNPQVYGFGVPTPPAGAAAAAAPAPCPTLSSSPLPPHPSAKKIDRLANV